MLKKGIVSGREGLSLADRSNLLHQTYMEMQKPLLTGDKKVDGANIHEFINFKCFVFAMVEQADPKYLSEKTEDWMKRLSFCECLVMAWNRGGLSEERKVYRELTR